MILATTIQFAFRPDGLIHFMQDGYDLPRGPLGLLLYLPFVGLFWLIRPKYRTAYLILSSLLLSLITLGHGYTLAIAALAIIGLIFVREFAIPARPWPGIAILTVIYAALLYCPQPSWLPPVEKPFYFYLHWAGIGFIFLKTVHVIFDVSNGKLPAPTTGGFLAYLLFAPTLRMGPIYRYDDFSQQLQDNHLRNLKIGGGLLRIFVGLVRLGIMAVVMDKFPFDTLFANPQNMSFGQMMPLLYAAPMSIYLWISGYIDLSIGIGRLMGFRVPENFNYPWRATSIAEFWRRWHITLGAWLRDYLYIPLGGNRRHVPINYIIIFLFTAVWHGTYLGYICWGLSQGIGMTVWRYWSRYWQKQRENNTQFYRIFARARLVNSPINIGLAWLLSFHYQIVTIAWFMDENHQLRLVGQRFIELLGFN
ncbi:MAG: MBOAT family protein [Planctomycetota bacterium]|nr:MAG: MBOAT family protein [Planctomycetota bacterium]